MIKSEDVPRLTKNLKDLSRIIGEINEIHSSESKNLKKAKVLLEKGKLVCDRLSDAQAIISSVKDQLETQNEALKEFGNKEEREFANRLDSELKKKSFSLQGHIPNLRVGFFGIEINTNEGKAFILYGSEHEKLLECPMEVNKVVEAIVNCHKNLGCGKSEAEFLDLLRTAFERATRLYNSRQIPLTTIHFEIAMLLQKSDFRIDPRKETFKPYKRSDFSFDLFRLKNSTSFPFQKTGVKLTVATREKTRRKDQFIWVPEDAQGNGVRYSAIELREVV